MTVGELAARLAACKDDMPVVVVFVHCEGYFTFHSEIGTYDHMVNRDGEPFFAIRADDAIASSNY